MAAENSPGFSEIQGEIGRLCQSLAIPSDNCQFRFEREDFLLEADLPLLEDGDFLETIRLCKKHLENWRIHTFDKGYLSLQALNENLFDATALLDNIKVRLSGAFGEKKLEVTRKKNITRTELSLILALISHFFGRKMQVDPLEMLRQSGCRVYLPGEDQISFDDFAGYRDVVDQVKETVILPLKHPDVYDKVTGSTRKKFASNRPKAVLFAGPPGTGKTTMSRIIGAETGLPLVYVPLENIMSAYYGESSKRLALIFDTAELAAQKGLLLFLDEIDALAPSRNDKIFEATRRMLSVLLRKIDGMESSGNILTIGATNRSQDLDPALLSRFDTILTFPHPAQEDIIALLKQFARQLAPGDLEKVSAAMAGFSPREIIDVCKQAERMRARDAIQKGEKEAAAPSVSDYLHASARKRAGIIPQTAE